MLQLPLKLLKDLIDRCRLKNGIGQFGDELRFQAILPNHDAIRTDSAIPMTGATVFDIQILTHPDSIAPASQLTSKQHGGPTRCTSATFSCEPESFSERTRCDPKSTSFDAANPIFGLHRPALPRLGRK
jgi:hypothetical protein